jgi:hypothetical protein
MDLLRLNQILIATTRQYRKGPEVKQSEVGPLQVIEVYDMPTVEDAPAEMEKVDVGFMVIGVDKARALNAKDDLVALLKTYPRPDELAGGPSYITVGAEIGDQGAALCLFALGQVAGLWQVITPATLGFVGEKAAAMMGAGFVMITGFRVEE